MGEKMVDGPCILHQGATCDGYGVKKHKKKNVRAHRLAYCQANDIDIESISGKVVMHSCDNRLCINPLHLSIGTHADNCADKVSKGRQARGDTGGNSRLKSSQVLEIRRLFDGGYFNAEIARIYGVSSMCISRIRSGKTWGHVWQE